MMGKAGEFSSLDYILRDRPCQRTCPHRSRHTLMRPPRSGRDGFADGHGDSEILDRSLARATMHVLAAYAELGTVDPHGLPQNAIPSFGSVCVSLCSTVVAIDELTAEVWGQGSPRTPAEPRRTEALQLGPTGDPPQGPLTYEWTPPRRVLYRFWVEARDRGLEAVRSIAGKRSRQVTRPDRGYWDYELE